MIRPDTLVVHTGLEPDPVTQAVAPGFHPSTIFRYPEDGYPGSDFFYSRHDNPNRRTLEAALADIEGGAHAVTFGSGLAAIQAVLQVIGTGNHLIAPFDIYFGARALIMEFVDHWGLQVDFVDMRQPDNVRAHIRPNTRLIWIESPSNPMLHIADIRAICTIAAEHGIWTGVDNTWPSPLLQRPLDLGADISMHSTTKYLGGHSDLLGGAVILKEDGELHQRIRTIQKIGGAVPSPFDCWLLLRSLRTLALRVQRQNESGMKIAQFLQDHPKITKVHYPGLPEHPNHEVAARQMSGFGGMISFEVDATPEEALALVSKTKLIAPATSLGSVESTWEHRFSTEGPDSKTPPTLIRLSVGIENPDDLIADIDGALRS